MLTINEQEARNHAGVNTTIASLLGDEFEVGPVADADFASVDIPLTLGIERKSFPNLCSSVMSGELDEQLSRMVARYDVAVLLVEGLPVPRAGKVRVPGARKDVNYAWLVGAMAGWFGRGVWPLCVESMQATAPTIADLYRTFSKPNHRSVFAPRRTLPTLRRATFSEELLLTFPNIGLKRAEQIASLRLTPLEYATMSVSSIGPP